LRSVASGACSLPAQQVMAMDEAACLAALRKRLATAGSTQRERLSA
jgi:hypothetical protein